MVAQLNPNLSSTTLITSTSTRTKLISVVVISGVTSTLETGQLLGCTLTPTDNTVAVPSALPTSQSGNGTAMMDRKAFVAELGSRGTLDILWGCWFTIILCVTTSVRINYPSVSETTWQVYARKLRWFVICFAAPEILMILATGQRREARRSVKLWRDSGYEDWTMRHGFYANMGGFLLRSKDSNPFPINAKQLHYLVTQDYIPYPAAIMQARGIEEPYTSNVLKIMVLIQVAWFLVQFLARASTSLTLTTLELTTIPYILCTLTTYYMWWHKPIDSPRSPIILRLETRIGQVLTAAGSIASKPYSNTPLDFLDDHSPSLLTEIYPPFRMKLGPRARPLQRFTNDRFPIWSIGSLASLLQLIVHVSYSAIYIAAWNFTFPSSFERHTWRVSSSVLVTLTITFYLLEIYMSGHRTGLWRRLLLRTFPTNPFHIARISAMEYQRKEVKFFSDQLVALLAVAGFLYIAARAYVVVEAFLSLRSLPAAAFKNVSWVNYFPHF